MNAKSFMSVIVTFILLMAFDIACFAQEQQSDNQSLNQEKPTSLSYVKSGKFLKTTREWCENHRGKYTPQKGILAQDMVDCLLPGTRGEKAEILGNAYDYLYRSSIEKPGYGLYSYVLLPSPSSRGEHFLAALFSTTSYVEFIQINAGNLNVIYLPTMAKQLPSLLPLVADGSAPPLDLFATKFYDYALAQKLLANICMESASETKSVCASDLSRGPYLFTYTQPVSSSAPASPPYLLVDLSNVHEAAFAELVRAYKEQVKRSNYSDADRINNFQERLLSIVLTAADTITPITDAIKNVILMVKGDAGGK